MTVESWSDFRQGHLIFCLHHSVYTGSGADWGVGTLLQEFGFAIYLLLVPRQKKKEFVAQYFHFDRLCGLVARVPGYRSRGPGFVLALPDLLRCSGSGMGSIQPREHN
jgi:hypothetical protein